MRLTNTAPSPVKTIPGYNLVEPSESDARAAMQRVFSATNAEERWAQACAQANVRVGFVQPGDELRKVVAALALQGGAAATVARSIEIRMRTFYRLSLTLVPSSTSATS